ncbi:MAG: hypothetical protein IKE43_01660 [Coriobacteriales bacterium]|nr:hypothetical protein [Coriobacteriales bacterium]
MLKRIPIFNILVVIVFALVIGLIVFIVWALMLRTEYKDTAFEINKAFLTDSSVTIIRGEESFPVSTDDAEYYNMFLLDNNTVVFSKDVVPVTDDTITIDFGEEQLSFTGYDDGSATAILWKTQENQKHFIVRSAITFRQLSAYYKNIERNHKA